MRRGSPRLVRTLAGVAVAALVAGWGVAQPLPARHPHQPHRYSYYSHWAAFSDRRLLYNSSARRSRCSRGALQGGLGDQKAAVRFGPRFIVGDISGKGHDWLTVVPRTDSVSRVLAATAARIYAALVDQHALVNWLPPTGMTGWFEAFNARPGGIYRMVLTYKDSSVSGKSGGASDVIVGQFVELTPNVRVVQSVVFDSDDSAFAGTMTMTWELRPADGDTEILFRADNIPEGSLPMITPRA